MSSIYSLGALSMMVFVPIVSDRFGRRASIMVGNTFMLIGAIIQACSQNRRQRSIPFLRWSAHDFIHAVGMFIASRFILGMGIPFALSGGAQLIGELAYHKERPQLTSAFNVSW